MVRRLRGLARVAAAGTAAAVAMYGAYVATTWLRYGKGAAPAPDQVDAILDRFMPIYDVAERHQIRVAALASITFAAASDMHLFQSAPVRLLFRARARIMGAAPQRPIDPQPFLASMTSLGWGVLAETPGQSLVMGAVTQPWLADVVFRPLPPEDFARFADPGYVTRLDHPRRCRWRRPIDLSHGNTGGRH